MAKNPSSAALRVAFAKATGAAHERRAQPCQDAVAGAAEPRVFLVVCDGCGSSAKSELASQAAVRRFSALVAAAEPALGALLDEPALDGAIGAAAWASLVHGWHGELGAVMDELARDHGTTTADFLFTWVAAVVGKSRCGLVHVGDGAIVGENEARALVLLSAPDNGAFANTTVFVRPGSPRPGDLRTALRARPAGLAVFTDGVESLFLNRGTGAVAPAMGAVFNHVRTTPDSGELASDLAAFLARPDWSAVTGDDRALAVWTP